MITVNPKAIYPGEIPYFDSNDQALAAGLLVGDIYHNSLGQLFVVRD